MYYLDKYPQCIGCPVSKYCGTMIQSTRLCKSYQPEEYEEDTQEDMDKEMYEDMVANDYLMEDHFVYEP